MAPTSPMHEALSRGYKGESSTLLGELRPGVLHREAEDSVPGQQVTG